MEAFTTALIGAIVLALSAVLAAIARYSIRSTSFEDAVPGFGATMTSPASAADGKKSGGRKTDSKKKSKTKPTTTATTVSGGKADELKRSTERSATNESDSSDNEAESDDNATAERRKSAAKQRPKTSLPPPRQQQQQQQQQASDEEDDLQLVKYAKNFNAELAKQKSSSNLRTKPVVGQVGKKSKTVKETHQQVVATTRPQSAGKSTADGDEIGVPTVAAATVAGRAASGPPAAAVTGGTALSKSAALPVVASAPRPSPIGGKATAPVKREAVKLGNAAAVYSKCL